METGTRRVSGVVLLAGGVNLSKLVSETRQSLAEETAKKAKAEAIRKDRATAGVNFTVATLTTIMTLMHWLVKGRAEEVAKAKEESREEVQYYNAVVDDLRYHFLHGSGYAMPIDGGGFRLDFRAEDLPDVAITSKVAAMKVLADNLTRFREVEPGNGDRLPPLMPGEICRQGVEIGALEEVGPNTAKALVFDGKRYAPAKNGNLAGEDLKQWEIVVGQLADHSRTVLTSPKMAPATVVSDMDARSTHKCLEQAMERGGEFAITVPDMKVEKPDVAPYVIKGGKVLLVFDNVGETVSVANKGTEAVATGDDAFVDRMSNLFSAGAEISYDHVVNMVLVEGNLESPVPKTPRINYSHMGLWYALRAYIREQYSNKDVAAVKE